MSDKLTYSGWSCPSGPAELVDFLVDRGEEVTYEEFAEQVEVETLPLEETQFEILPTDWHVTYLRTETPSGQEAWVIQHSGIEHLCVPPEVDVYLEGELILEMGEVSEELFDESWPEALEEDQLAQVRKVVLQKRQAQTRTATIRKCKPSEKDPDHEELAEWQQTWCVVDSDGNLKGRHRSKNDAGKQESAIRMSLSQSHRDGIKNHTSFYTDGSQGKMNAFTIRFWDGDTYTANDLQTALAIVVEEFPQAEVQPPSSRNGSAQWIVREDLRIIARIRVQSELKKLPKKASVIYDEQHNRVTLFRGAKNPPKNDVWEYTGKEWIEVPNDMELASLDDAGEVLIDLAGVINRLYDNRDAYSIQRLGSLVKDLVDVHTILEARS